MALIKNNPITQGFSGMLGDTYVFRNWNGKTIVSMRPKLPKKQSAQQKSNRDRFRAATEFAQAVTSDPEKKEYYRQKAVLMKLPNAYTAAITDYMRRPAVVTEKQKDGSAKVTFTKKDFTLNKVEVTQKTKGADVVLRTITPNAFDDCVVILTSAELAMEVVLKITDAAESLFAIDAKDLYERQVLST